MGATVPTAESTGAHAGGKARNLRRLAEAGLPVPRFAALGADVLDRFLRASGLGEEVERALAGLEPETAGEVAARIERAFAEAELDADASGAVEEAYERAGAGAVAVRSSGIDEDSATLSFAGQYASFLNVAGPAAVADRVKACWASAYSARALTYRLLHDLPAGARGMGVVVQAIVAADKSGVLFTVDPSSGSEDELVIGAVYGLGEGLVSGAVDADTVVVERASGRVVRTVVGEKRDRIDPAAGGETATTEVELERREGLALTEPEIAELHRCGLRVESVFGAPQDLEWALADGELWVLQSRPITTAPRETGGELRVWDNSNIIESYGEIVAPLTYTFARNVYHRVYRDYARIVGVPRGQIAQMDDWLPNMLGYFNGRVYYNLLNWYKVIRLLPFYALNRRVLELSMGVQQELTPELYDEQRPLRTDSRAAELAIRARIAARFTAQFFTIERSVDRFIDEFYRVYDEFDAIDYSGRPADEVYRVYRGVEERLLARWGRMIVLEATIGMAYGTLHLLNQRWLADAPGWLQYEVVKVDEGVESAAPAERLKELAARVRADESLGALMRDVAPEDAYDALRSVDHPAARELLAEVDRYLDEFGYRNVNELKLEEPDLREDPSLLFSMLNGAIGQLDAPARDTTESADAYLDRRLRGWRRTAYELVRRKARRSLGARERVRFCRTRAFGMARRMFQAMGEDLARAGVLASPRDVFYLRLEELRGCFDGTIAHRELEPLVALRKAQEAQHRELVPPPRFETRGSAYGDDLERAWRDAASAAADDGDWQELRGTAASPGVVVGEARVVERPSDVDGNVLVTYRTDPGWIGVLSSASALLIERGSPLTHVAIVARELGIPTVVQIPGLTTRVRSGTRIRVDGGAGTVAVEAEASERGTG